MNLRICVALALLVGCGGRSGAGTDSDANGGGDGGGSGTIDAPPYSGMCNATSGKQCSNCKDDDLDGLIDGFDPQCTGATDDDERTFATGIPGDNKDAVMQDCFFDGNSGAGGGDCNIHVCCLLGATTVGACKIGANKYNPAECPPPIGTGTVTQSCINRCGKLAPPGCDCFGCCTICDPNSPAGSPPNCHDIIINPQTSPECGPTTLGDPNKCLRCTKNPQCGNPQCGGQTCILCPGQDPDTLPSNCNGMTTCPAGQVVCGMDGACPEGAYCSSGCCIAVIL